MKDGTAEFKTVDARVAAIFDLIYPVGSVFATTGSAPELGTWEEIAQGRTLQGADNSHAAGSTVEAGLPNITGSFSIAYGDIGCFWKTDTYGAFANGEIQPNSISYSQISQQAYDRVSFLGFSASRSSSIYGNSTTVQPPAYIVHFYRRIA